MNNRNIRDTKNARGTKKTIIETLVTTNVNIKNSI